MIMQLQLELNLSLSCNANNDNTGAVGILVGMWDVGCAYWILHI
jgi:hypothetical protein